MSHNSQNLYSPFERLELYLLRINELRGTQLLSNGFNPSFDIYSDFTQNISKINSFEPNEDDFRSFLTIYRKFISRNSPIYLDTILATCHTHLKNEKLKENLIEVEQSWNDKFENGVLKLNINQKDYNPKKILSLWINGVYFHDDYEKINELKSLLTDEYFTAATRFIFFSLISTTTRDILYVDSVIRTAFQNNDFDL